MKTVLMGQTYADLPDLCAAHEPRTYSAQVIRWRKPPLTALRFHRMLSVLNLRAQATVQSEKQCVSHIWLCGSWWIYRVRMAEREMCVRYAGAHAARMIPG